MKEEIVSAYWRERVSQGAVLGFFGGRGEGDGEGWGDGEGLGLYVWTEN